MRGAPVTREKQRFALEQRRQPTPSEVLAWSLLPDRRCLGLKFRRQQVIGRFVADLYCPELHVAIEIDGGIHDDPDVASHDEVRELELLTHGIVVLRVRAEDVTAEHFRDVLAARLAPQHDEQSRPLSRGPLTNPATATASSAVGGRGRGGNRRPRRPRGG